MESLGHGSEDEGPAYRGVRVPFAECARACGISAGCLRASAHSAKVRAYDRRVSTYAVRVKPGASRTRVGGAYGDPPALIVAVTEPAIDGRATDAVLKALAQALGVRRADLDVVSGHTSRSKLIRINEESGDLAQRWAALLEG